VIPSAIRDGYRRIESACKTPPPPYQGGEPGAALSAFRPARKRLAVVVRPLVVCVFALISLAANTAKAESSAKQRFADAQAVFDSAKQAMQDGGTESVEARQRFHEAATQFTAIARDGTVSPNLCVNAGNAFHFAGDEPRALLWYLKAMQLANTPETRNGVTTLRRTCGAELWPPEPTSIGRVLMSWHYDVSRRTKQRLMLATYPLGCVLVIVSLFARRRPMWLRLGLVLICIGATMGISDVATSLGPGDRWAVVVEGGKGYAGDGEGYSVVVDGLKPGQEVKLIETRPEWVRVALPNGTTCWVRAGTCDEV
jgi:hypothetical protein